MYEKIATGSDKMLAYRITGKITKEEYEKLRAQLEQAFAQSGKLRMYVEIDHLKFPEAGVLWEDLKFSMQHINDCERFAVVGDKAWEKWWVQIVGSMIPADAKYFDHSQKEEAWRWVRNE